jgi:hypothetical protein
VRCLQRHCRINPRWREHLRCLQAHIIFQRAPKPLCCCVSSYKTATCGQCLQPTMFAAVQPSPPAAAQPSKLPYLLLCDFTKHGFVCTACNHCHL